VELKLAMTDTDTRHDDCLPVRRRKWEDAALLFLVRARPRVLRYRPRMRPVYSAFVGELSPKSSLSGAKVVSE